ncbi:MAG: LUD domain-containing protein [Terrimicrobiaceae bacterium]
MTGKEIILGRIREALKVEAPHAHASSDLPVPAHTPPVPRDWLPPVGETFESRSTLFAANSAALKTSYQVCKTADELVEGLNALATKEGWKRIAYHSDPSLTPLAKSLADSGVEALDVNAGFDKGALEACQAGLTTCECLVAQTGSVLVSSRSNGGRSLTVLPPHHIVIAYREQMVADLTDALDLVKQRYGANYPSMLSFITGPSRTGDIERILVLGAHGPKNLTIFLLDSEA